MITAFQACERASWLSINPQLTISGDDARIGDVPSVGADQGGFDGAPHSERFWEDGYFLIRDLLPVDSLTDLRAGIENLVANGLPPAMIYLYDEAWQVFRRLRPLLNHFLGDRVKLLPHFWAWHVNPGEDGRGWPPHRDYQGESAIGDDMLISLSLWVPLGIANPDNGCMYVLPRSFEKCYHQPVAKPEDVALQDVRALPAGPGTVMGWRQDLYHWGGRSSAFASEPRISLSLEFQNAAFDPMADRLLDLEQPPVFRERLELIVQQFAKYRHMQSMDDNTLRWVDDIIVELSGRA
ncbi:phytanoyl-CoA dioxygenase family protein [Thalassospira sp. A3_1]|uniref:phytanoyl-CoA dioxygenase family protein n=1 Tax=Thalassospira sp. A3_1 TaxID=2821088 RepID=UPI001AD9CE5E|nr:phytanoyl-CoA dioxygenase family protein [Thalassospira sp. A3_1]MBO9508098.1 phytanoyl-CoA dioxygenase family protein [Thalassospira sp. A3_1]